MNVLISYTQLSIACIFVGFLLYFVWWNGLYFLGNLYFTKIDYFQIEICWPSCSSKFVLYFDVSRSFICYGFFFFFPIFFPFNSSSTQWFPCNSFILIIFQKSCFFSCFCLIRVWKAHHLGFNGWSRSKLCDIWKAWGSVALCDTLFVWFLFFSFFLFMFFIFFILFYVLISIFLCCIFKETPEPFPLPTEASIVKAAAGWAHCASVTGTTDFHNCIQWIN